MSDKIFSKRDKLKFGKIEEEGYKNLQRAYGICLLSFISILILLSPLALSQGKQSHPLSQITPIDITLNMSNNTAGISQNITGVGYLGIGIVGLPSYRLDVAGSAWIRPELFIGANLRRLYDTGSMFGIDSSLYLTGDIQIGGNDIMDSGGVIRLTLGNPLLVASGTNLNLANGDLQIGGTSVITSARNIINVNWVNVSDVNVSNQLCLGGICKSSWPASLVGGSGTANYITKWLDLSTLTSSIIYETGGNVGIGTTSPVKKLDVVGDINATAGIYSGTGYYVGTTQIVDSSRNVKNVQDVNATRFFQSGVRVINTVTAGTGLTGGGSGPSVTLSIDTNVVPQKSVAETISAIWNFANGLKVGGGYENNALTIDQYGNILTKGNLTYSGYTYVVSTLEFNGTANYPFGINVGGSYSGGAGINGQIDIRPSGSTSPKARISTDGTDLIINTALYGANLRVNGTILPYMDNQFDLGSSSYQWANIYGGTVYEGGTALSSKYVPQSRQVLAGAGLTGGGNLSADRSFAIAFGEDFLGWRNLTNYPAGCGANEAVQAIGDTLTCVPITPGGSGVTGSGTVGYIAMWNGTNSLNNSIINQTAGNIWITSGNLNILSGALQIAGTTVIDSSRNLVGINLVNQNLNMNSNSIINAAWVNATNLNSTTGIYGGFVRTAAGSASAPSFSFITSTNTGMFSSAANTINFATGGTTKLTISTSEFTGTLPWRGQDGTASAPALSFSADTNTGIFRPAADAVAISTGGAERMRITNTTAGEIRIGIGTTAPVKTFDVVGDINATAGVYGATLYEGGTALSSKYVPQSRQVLAGAGLTGGGDLSADRSFAIAFGEDFLGWRNLTNYPAGCGANEAVQAIGDTLTCVPITPGGSGVTGSGSLGYIPLWNGTNSLNNSIIYQSGGNVGIGTTIPGRKLEVYDATPAIRYNRAGEYSWTVGVSGVGDTLGAPYSYFVIRDDSYATPRLVISHTSGNVGIGTTSPLTKLDVVGNVNASVYYDRENSARYLDPSGTSVIGAMNMYGNLNMNNYNINGIGNLYGYGTLNYYPAAVTTNPAHVFKSGDGTNWVDRLTIGGNAATVDVSISNSNFVVNSNQLYVRRSDGNIGIGTTAPLYKLDVAGNIRAQTSLTAGINVENLTGNKTLTPGVDKMFQFLNPNGANRIVYLATTTANAGDKFIIKNNDSYSSFYYLQIQQGSTVLDYIYARSIREYIFDGTNWVSGDVGTGIAQNDYNVAIGYNAAGHSNGVAVGYNAAGRSNGVAVGYNAAGHSNGVAVGYGATGHSSGVAVGTVASGQSNGVAVGLIAYGYNLGAAVGYAASGHSSGAAVGAYAKGMRYGAALGYLAGYNIDTTADRYNVLVGAYSGYQLTTGIGNIIIGYQSGYDATYSPTTGSKNILIGFQAGTPSNTTSNFLNIGNLIFATGVNTATGTAISTGNVGIGTTAPGYKLDVAGALRLQPSSAPTGANGVIYYDSTANKFKCYEGGAWKDCISAGAIGGSGTTNYLAKWTASTTLGNSIIYDNGTNVGIGTTSPNYPLSFGSGLANTKLAIWDGGAGGTAFGLGVQSGQFRFHVNNPSDRFSFLNGAAGTEIVTILGNGNVGIGTTAPSEKLEVAGNVKATGNFILGTGAPNLNTTTNSIRGDRFLYASDETNVTESDTNYVLKKQFSTVFHSTRGFKPRFVNVVARLGGAAVPYLNFSIGNCGWVQLSGSGLQANGIDVSSCADGVYLTNIYLRSGTANSIVWNDIVEVWFVK
jgi:hypothetical protein